MQLHAQDDASDTWFEKQIAGDESSANENGETDKSSAGIPKKASPTSVYNALMKEYERASEGNLTKRIELLSRATKALPNQSSEAAATLKSLLQQKSEIVSALDAAASRSPIEQAIASLAPYNRYFNLDLDLSQMLLESPFAARIENALKDAASRSDFAAMQSLRNSVESAGLSNLVRSRIDPLTSDSENAAILSKWNAAIEQQAPLKGERFLVSRALRQADAKLGVAIQIKAHGDTKVAEPIKTGIERHLGSRFAPVPTDQADLLVTLDVGGVVVSESIAESTKSSVVPGAIDEQPNPKFVKLVAKYEKAAKLYEEAVKAYDVAFENWLDMREEADPMLKANTQRAEAAVHQAEAVARNAGPGPGASGANQQVLEAKAEYRLADSIEKLSAPMNLPEPIKPTPVHLDILQDVYATPSTIVISKEEEPYEYTSQRITASFNSQGSLAIETSGAARADNDEPISLSRERAWTRNLDVNPRDPAVNAGDYSPEAVNSAKDLFLLEFASECAKKFQSLIGEEIERCLSVGLDKQDPQAVVLALSLKASDESFALPDNEVQELTRLALNQSVSPQQLRRECLASVARVALAASPEKQAKAIALLTR